MAPRTPEQKDISPLAEELISLLDYAPFQQVSAGYRGVARFADVKEGVYDEIKLVRLVADFFTFLDEKYRGIPDFLVELQNRLLAAGTDFDSYERAMLPMQERRLSGADVAYSKTERELGSLERGFRRTRKRLMRTLPLAQIQIIAAQKQPMGELVERAKVIQALETTEEKHRLLAGILSDTRSRMTELGIPLAAELKAAAKTEPFTTVAIDYGEYPAPRQSRPAPDASDKPTAAKDAASQVESVASASDLTRSVLRLKELIALAGKQGTITVVVPHVTSHAQRHLNSWRALLRDLNFEGRVVSVEPKRIGRATNASTVILLPYVMNGISNLSFSNPENVRVIPVSQPKLIANFLRGTQPAPADDTDEMSDDENVGKPAVSNDALQQ